MPVAMTDQEIIAFLVLVIRHSDVKPDYHAIAAGAGIPKAMNAQRRLKTIIDDGGLFKISGKAIIDVGAPAAPASPVVTGPKKGKKAVAKPAPKKRKIEEVEAEEDEDDVDNGNVEISVEDVEEESDVE